MSRNAFFTNASIFFRSFLTGLTALVFSFAFLFAQVLYAANTDRSRTGPVILFLACPLISILYMYIADQIQKQFNDHTAYIRIYLINLAVWIAFYNLGYLVIYSLGIIFLLNFWMIGPYGHTRRFLFANSMAFVFFLLLMTVLQAITPLRLCDCDFERINSCFTDDMSPLDIYKNLFCNDISATDIFGTLLVAYSGFVHAFFGLSGIRFKSNAS